MQLSNLPQNSPGITSTLPSSQKRTSNRSTQTSQWLWLDIHCTDEIEREEEEEEWRPMSTIVSLPRNGKVQQATIRFSKLYGYEYLTIPFIHFSVLSTIHHRQLILYPTSCDI